MNLHAKPGFFATLGYRLAERAQHSALGHRDCRTVRREDHAWWTEAAQGCLQATLWQRPGSRIAVLRLAAGAEMPWPGDVTAQEVLVLKGYLRASGVGRASEVLLAPQAYALRGEHDAGSLTAIDAEAQVDVRQRRVDLSTLPEPEAQWWRLQRAPLQRVPAGMRC